MRPFSKIVRSVKAFREELARRQGRVVEAPAPLPLAKRPRIGIALGGGFARGMTHIGVLKVFEQERIPIDYIAGTSVGAVIGAAYCSGMSAKEMEEIAMLVRFKDFARWTISRFALCSNDRMTGFLEKLLKVPTFEKLRIPLAVAATDLTTGQGVVFKSGSLIDAVRASCAYPGMFLPVNLDGKLYVDGLLGYPVPAKPLREMGAERVISVHLAAHWVTGKGPRHIFDVIGQCFSIAQERMSTFWKQHTDLMVEPDIARFGYDEFQRSPEMIAIGEAATRAILPQVRAWLEGTQPELAPAELQTQSAEKSSSKVSGAPALQPTPLTAK
ncbi:MAG TPA: patatin-like phospholipase family protein [Terriglobales bacterium]|jgi:NTE family protein|nr:patatin-like phospholipase family protein [Terriglobales bacterium]